MEDFVATVEVVTVKDKPKRRVSIFEHVFLHYGAGSTIFKPLTTSRLWNRICWAAIALGIIGWVVAFWFLRDFAE